MDQVRSVIEYLKDPQLVADFQSFCGVKRLDIDKDGKPLSNTVKHELSVNEAGDVNTCIVQNGCSVEIREKLLKRKQELTKGGKSEDPEELKYEDLYVIEYPLLYYIFRFSSALGNESFYTLFLPACIWAFDSVVARQQLLFWAFYMYVGQALKDIIKWPRPASPPVIQLERRYVLEYGMPSTHAMVGTGIPTALVWFTQQRYEIPVMAAWSIVFVWSVLVPVSRLYMGMHSLADITGGIILVYFLMFLCFPWIDEIDEFMTHHDLGIFVSSLGILLLCILYPSLKQWSTARGDTTLIMGVTAGVYISYWILYMYDLVASDPYPPPFLLEVPSAVWIGKLLGRYIVGSAIFIPVKVLLKYVIYTIACLILGLDKKDIKSRQLIIVELPYYFFTYTVVAVMVALFCPLLFAYLGIEKDGFLNL